MHSATSFICEVFHIISEAEKVVLEGVGGEGNDYDDNIFFIGKQDVVRAVLAFMKIFGSLFLKKNIAGNCILCCLLFCLLSFSLIIIHHPELC